MAEKNLNEMTLDECREELGRLPHLSVQGNPPRISNTLDAIAGAMPDGWAVSIENTRDFSKREVVWVWEAHGTRRSAVGTRGCCGANVRDATADTEILARARLAVACWRATKGEQR